MCSSYCEESPSFLEESSVANSSFLLLGSGLTGGFHTLVCWPATLPQTKTWCWMEICILSVCVCVCVCVSSLWVAGKREQEGEEQKGSRRRWKRMSLERKAREHKGTRARSSILQAPKRKCRGREKEGRGKLELQNPLPSTHTDSSKQTLLFILHMFSLCLA